MVANDIKPKGKCKKNFFLAQKFFPQDLPCKVASILKVFYNRLKQKKLKSRKIKKIKITKS